jgi:hypothetical protein
LSPVREYERELWKSQDQECENAEGQEQECANGLAWAYASALLDWTRI